MKACMVLLEQKVQTTIITTPYKDVGIGRQAQQLPGYRNSPTK